MRKSVLLLVAILLVALTTSLAACGFLPGADAAVTQKRPNVFVVLADDMRTEQLQYMDSVQTLIEDQGVHFSNYVFVDPLCCPNRTTMFRGQYPTNHGVTDNSSADGTDDGGYAEFVERGHANDNLVTKLDGFGYRTGNFGKYLNGYKAKAVPPGWDKWATAYGTFTDGRINKDGLVSTLPPGTLDRQYGDRFIKWTRSNLGSDTPIFAIYSPYSPHENTEVEDRYANSYNGLQPPQEAYNKKDPEKPDYVSDLGPLTTEEKSRLQEIYEEGAEGLQTVDDVVDKLITLLEDTGEIDNSYVMFVSDNGSHHGDHRLAHGKMTPYASDIEFPLLVRGPNVPANRTATGIVGSHDFMPTVMRFAGMVGMPAYVDGRSFKPLAQRPARAWARTRVMSMNVREDTDVGRAPTWYGMVERLGGQTDPHTYAEYPSTGEKEFYDHASDPYYLDNTFGGLPIEEQNRLAAKVANLKVCRGNDPGTIGSCYDAENGE